MTSKSAAMSYGTALPNYGSVIFLTRIPGLDSERMLLLPCGDLPVTLLKPDDFQKVAARGPYITYHDLMKRVMAQWGFGGDEWVGHFALEDEHFSEYGQGAAMRQAATTATPRRRLLISSQAEWEAYWSHGMSSDSEVVDKGHAVLRPFNVVPLPKIDIEGYTVESLKARNSSTSTRAAPQQVPQPQPQPQPPQTSSTASAFASASLRPQQAYSLQQCLDDAQSAGTQMRNNVEAIINQVRTNLAADARDAAASEVSARLQRMPASVQTAIQQISANPTSGAAVGTAVAELVTTFMGTRLDTTSAPAQPQPQSEASAGPTGSSNVSSTPRASPFTNPAFGPGGSAATQSSDGTQTSSTGPMSEYERMMARSRAQGEALNRFFGGMTARRNGRPMDEYMSASSSTDTPPAEPLRETTPVRETGSTPAAAAATAATAPKQPASSEVQSSNAHIEDLWQKRLNQMGHVADPPRRFPPKTAAQVPPQPSGQPCAQQSSDGDSDSNSSWVMTKGFEEAVGKDGDPSTASATAPSTAASAAIQSAQKDTQSKEGTDSSNEALADAFAAMLARSSAEAKSPFGNAYGRAARQQDQKPDEGNGKGKGKE